jgi:broad specificity phosphatase PhoE
MQAGAALHQLAPPRQKSRNIPMESPQAVRKTGPTEIILVRHGLSEANKARKLEETGKMSYQELTRFLEEVRDHRVRLATDGVEQARRAGKKLRELGFKPTPRALFVSDFTRAMETALELSESAGFGEVQWKVDPRVGERSWGEFHLLDQASREIEYQSREEDPRRWVPARGESLRDVSLQVGQFVDRLYREHSEEQVLVVTHGELISGWRAAFERLSDQDLAEAIRVGVPNCGIVHYSRRNPVSGETARSFQWVRFITDDPQGKYQPLWNGDWREIKRKQYSLEDLRKVVEERPRRL